MRVLATVLLSRILTVFAVFFALTARAHFIIPEANTFGNRDQYLTVGDTFETSVAPSGVFDTCTVLAVVTVGDSSVLDGGGTKTEKFPKFTLTAKKAGKSSVTVFFAGQTNDEGFDCPAIQEVTYNITVRAKISTASTPGSGSDADPVNTFSGELFMDAPGPDIDLDGPMPLYFQRYYGSYLRRAFVLGDLGNNWRHNFDARLQWNGTRAIYTSWKGKVTTFDKEGEVWVQADNLEVPYQLIAVAGDVRLFDPEDERVYSFDYSTGGPVTSKLIRVEDGRGNAHDISYDEDGRLLSVGDDLGRLLTFTYKALTEEDQIPKIQSVSDGTRTVTFLYQDALDAQNLTEVIDARGGSTVFTYEDTNNNADHALMLTLRRPEGNIPYSQSYFGTSDGDVSGRVKWQIDALGNLTAFNYDLSGGITTVTDPGGESNRQHTHNSDGKLLRHRDEGGQDIDLAYDGNGRRSTFADRDSSTVQTTYHAPSGYPSVVTHEDGSTTSYQYVARVFEGFNWFDLSQVTFPDGTVENYSFDANGNVTALNDRNGEDWTWTYNALGQMLTETNPAGGVTTYGYNPDGTLASETNPDGVTYSYAYDALLRVVSVTREDGSASSITYDAHNNVTSVTDELNNTTQFSYDRNDNLILVVDALEGETSYAYDGLDRLVSLRDSEGNTTTYAYDERGRLITETNPDGSVGRFEYDAVSRVVATTDASGRRSTLSYSADGALLTSSTPSGETTTFGNDENKDPVSITTPRGFTSTLERDPEGRVISGTDALSQVTQIQRDPDGQANRITLPGQDVEGVYARNGLGLLTDVTDGRGNTWSSVRTVSGHLSSVTDPLGRTRTATLDPVGRLGVRALADGGTTTDPMGTITLTYDAADRLTGKSFSDGESVSFSYDALGRLTAASGSMIVGDRTSQEPQFAPMPTVSLAYVGETEWIADSNGLAMTYDSRGRIATLTYAPGRTVTYVYDGEGRPVSIADWNGGTTILTYDASGRRASIIRPNGVVTTYSYDVDGNVTGILDGAVSGQLSNIQLTRDPLGRIVEAQRDTPQVGTAPGGPTQSDYFFDAANQLVGYTYDFEGRATGGLKKSLIWDLESRLRAMVEDQTVDYAYEYDAFGALVRRVVEIDARTTPRSGDAAEREFVWNYATSLRSMAVERRDGADYMYYITEPDGSLLYRIDAADNRVDYHFDEGGNTILLTDGSGAVTDSYAYTPYGRITASSGSSDNPFTWRGQTGVWHEALADDDLYYMRERWYEAESMRFLSEDPARLSAPDEMNRYAYAALDPLQYHDPTGLAPERRSKHGSSSCTSTCARCCSCYRGRGRMVAPPVGGKVLQGRIWGTVILGPLAGLENLITGESGQFTNGLRQLWGAKPLPKKKPPKAAPSDALDLGAYYRGRPVFFKRVDFVKTCYRGCCVHRRWTEPRYYIGSRTYTQRQLKRLELEWDRANWQKVTDRRRGMCVMDRTVSDSRRKKLTKKYKKYLSPQTGGR